MDRLFLEEAGFGCELASTRKRLPKVSANAKAALLLYELYCRRRDVEEFELPKDSASQTEREKRDRANAHDIDAARWDAQRLMERSFTGGTPASMGDRLFSIMDAALEAERESNAQAHRLLASELGLFASRTADQQAASVRKWEERRRKRIR